MNGLGHNVFLRTQGYVIDGRKLVGVVLHDFVEKISEFFCDDNPWSDVGLEKGKLIQTHTCKNFGKAHIGI